MFLFMLQVLLQTIPFALTSASPSMLNVVQPSEDRLLPVSINRI